METKPDKLKIFQWLFGVLTTEQVYLDGRKTWTHSLQEGPGFDSFYDDIHFNESGASRVAAVLSPLLEKIRKDPAPSACE